MRLSGFLVESEFNSTLRIVSFGALFVMAVLFLILASLGRVELDIPQGSSTVRRAPVWQLIFVRSVKPRK